jgi:hypothetical protein
MAWPKIVSSFPHFHSRRMRKPSQIFLSIDLALVWSLEQAVRFPTEKWSRWNSHSKIWFTSHVIVSGIRSGGWSPWVTHVQSMPRWVPVVLPSKLFKPHSTLLQYWWVEVCDSWASCWRGDAVRRLFGKLRWMSLDCGPENWSMFRSLCRP